jgi:lactate dehydrogenase-like 2-hydroxyacid dehydrogenase
MNPSAILISTNRGVVVDAAALIQPARHERLAGLGLDVYKDQPWVTAEVRELPNIYPLMACWTHERPDPRRDGTRGHGQGHCRH